MMKRFAVVALVSAFVTLGVAACGVKGDQEYPNYKGKNVPSKVEKSKKGSWVK